MARKTILVCDKCGKEVEEAKGAVLRVTYSDARRMGKQADARGETHDCDGPPPDTQIALHVTGRLRFG